MATVTPRYLVDENNTPTDVVLTLGQWHEIVEQLEMLADIRAFDAAKAEPGEAIPLDRVVDQFRERHAG